MPTKTKTEPKSLIVGKAGSYGQVVSVSHATQSARDLADAVGQDAHAATNAEIINELSEAKAEIDANGDLSNTGKANARREVAEEALRRITAAVRPLLKRITTKIAAIVGDESAGEPITLREVLASQYGGRADLASAVADELAASLRMIREHVLLSPGTTPAQLAEYFERVVTDGDHVGMYAVDGLPRVLRARIFARAALDDAAASRLRRRLRMTAGGHGEQQLEDLCAVGSQIAFNAASCAKQVENAGFVARDKQRELEGELHTFRQLLAHVN